MKMKLAIDLDGVIMNSIGKWVEKFHPELSYHGLLSWNFYNYAQITYVQFIEELSKLSIHEIKPIFNAPKHIRNLIDDQHECFILTAREELLREQAQKWLKIYNLDDLKIIYDVNKLSHDFDYLIDDNPCYMHPRIIQFKQPWNLTAECYQSVNTWNELYFKIKNGRIA